MFARGSVLPAIGLALPLAAGLGASCGDDPPAVDTGVIGLALEDLEPEIVVPGTRLEVRGRSFVDDSWGEIRLRVEGEKSGGGPAAGVDAALPVEFRDFSTGVVRVDDAALRELGGAPGQVTGEAWVEVESRVDGEVHASDAIPLELALSDELEPELGEIRGDGLAFVNDPLFVAGAGFLLGGDEGDTVAAVEGCFRPAGEAECAETAEAEIPLESVEGDRQGAVLPLSPAIAGIEPGAFDGVVRLRNEHAGGAQVESAALPLAFELTEPAVFELRPERASVGQYVFVEGGGFVGPEHGTTELSFSGRFIPDDGEAVDADILLVPEVESGPRARFVISETEGIGDLVDARYDTGVLDGRLTPVVTHGGAKVEGDELEIALELAPVKQVVELRFLDSYVESLRAFGLRAVDDAIRDRVTRVVERDYDTINLEVRREEVEDYALHAIAEIAGPDPNDLGLLGYDNTPGKDVGNERLYDRIGGVNAQTQEDGHPGYGGVFIESLLALSEEGETSLSDPVFDEIFDPLRPDRGGAPVRARDLEGGVPTLSSGGDCPAASGDREAEIGCAIWVLGSLIGTTLSHEIGHSLGLANPFGSGVHNDGSADNRLMDAGPDRPFLERAELLGHGPGRFCDQHYEYLRDILPTDEPFDIAGRPPCF